MYRPLVDILHGTADMLRLRSSWCVRIGNDRTAFWWALVINILAIPVAIWFSPPATEIEETLNNLQKFYLEAAMLPIVLMTVYALAFCRRRHEKFTVIYAGITYSGVAIAGVLLVVEQLIALYGQSLYMQDAPMLVHSLLFMALLWMLVLMSFVFKTALNIGAAASLIMTAILLFVIIVGRLWLQIWWFS